MLSSREAKAKPCPRAGGSSCSNSQRSRRKLMVDGNLFGRGTPGAGARFAQGEDRGTVLVQPGEGETL